MSLVPIDTYLPQELLDKIRSLTNKETITISAWIRRALLKEVNRVAGVEAAREKRLALKLEVKAKSSTGVLSQQEKVGSECKEKV